MVGMHTTSARSAACATLLFCALVPLTPAHAATNFNQILSIYEQQYVLPSGCLAKIARVESNGNPQARNKSTDAAGMFQWIPRSWLYASNALLGGRSYTLQERYNPTTAAEVTAFSLKRDQNALQNLFSQAKVDGCLGLYMAHFLGQGGARKFLTAYLQNPNANACSIFPRECAYNRGVFANRTLGGVLQFLAGRLGTSAPTINVAGNFEDAQGNPLPYSPAHVSSRSFMPEGYKPSGQDFSRTYFDDYKNPIAPDVAPQSGPTAPLPSTALLVIAQSETIAVGKTTLISWVSAGVQQGSCAVREEVTQTELWSGSQGTKPIPKELTKNSAILTFVLRCKAVSGESVQAGVTVSVL